MGDKKPKKTRGRWQTGNERYPKAESEGLAKYREADGWRNGARVRKP